MPDDPLACTGVVGDRRSAALVREGSVDWWCPDRFDEPSVCARILDERQGGRFVLRPAQEAVPWTAYDGETNVLATTWTGKNGRLLVHDLMPLDGKGLPPHGEGTLLRIARCIEGEVRVSLEFAPRPAYGAETPAARAAGPRMVTFSSPSTRLFLTADRDLEAGEDACHGTWTLEAGQGVAVTAGTGEPVPTDLDGALSSLERTRTWWRRWAAKCHYQGPYRSAVVRSALMLELLTYHPTGAVVAAATTSLPEWPGGMRNWDYRFVWLRDAAFAVDAYHESGHTEEALRLAEWIHRVLRHADDLEVLYRVDGSGAGEEHELAHLAGHRDSRPVRVGNGAVDQFQLDVYGELVECLHLCRRLAGDDHEQRDWPHVREVIEHVRRRWREPDHGIWEVRGPPRHYVLSKALAWVALDRGLQAMEEMALPGPEAAWRQEAEAVRSWVLEHGYDARQGSFVQAQGSDALDASNLLLPLLGFLPADDPRIVGTVDAVREHLEQDGLVHRYLEDGMGQQAPFAACSFWLVEVLAQQGRTQEAHELLGGLLRRATPLGLYAQNLGRAGEHLGNFPQALTHIALIGAAVALERADRHKETASPHLLHAQRGWAGD